MESRINITNFLQECAESFGEDTNTPNEQNPFWLAKRIIEVQDEAIESLQYELDHKCIRNEELSEIINNCYPDVAVTKIAKLIGEL